VGDGARGSGSGGYTITPPGELPTKVTPSWGGGYKTQPPGEPPTEVRLSWPSFKSEGVPIPVPVIELEE
jgi:hypothetical protein